MTDLGHVVPVMRIFDERLAREFYVDRLGFSTTAELPGSAKDSSSGSGVGANIMS